MSRHDPAFAREACARPARAASTEGAPEDAATAPRARPIGPCDDFCDVSCDELRCPLWRLCRGWGG